jgi:hypothetical protein
MTTITDPDLAKNPAPPVGPRWAPPLIRNRRSNEAYKLR